VLLDERPHQVGVPRVRYDQHVQAQRDDDVADRVAVGVIGRQREHDRPVAAEQVAEPRLHRNRLRGVGDQISMGEQTALRSPCRPAGEQNRVCIRGVTVDR